MKLRIKFFLISALIALIPSSALTIIAYQQYVQSMDNRISAIVSEQFNNMVQTAGSTYSTIQRAFHMMTYYEESGGSVVGSLKRINNSSIALTPYEQYTEHRNIHRFTSIVNYAFDDIHGIYVFDASGTMTTCINTDYTSITEMPLRGTSSGTRAHLPWMAISTSVPAKQTLFLTDRRKLFFLPDQSPTTLHANLSAWLYLNFLPKRFI